MFALDLFNNDHERRIAEGAVDQLEQRRIDDLAMKMDDLVARAKTAKTAEVKAALMKEFQKCKAERDSYYKVRNETMGYGTLAGEGQTTPTATGLRHHAKPGNYGGYQPEPELKGLNKTLTKNLEKGMGVEFKKGGVGNRVQPDMDEAGIPGNVPVEKIPGKEDLLKGKGRSYYEATGDSKFDAMMGKISKDPWTQLNSDPNWEYEIEELVAQHIEPWLLAMEKSGMPITRDNETLNPGWRKRYEQVSTQLAQKYLASKKFNPRDPDLVGKIRAAIDWHTNENRNVAGQLSAYANDLPMQRYADSFDANGMTANIRDAMAGLAPRDDDDDGDLPTRPRPEANPRRLDPGNIEEGNFIVATKPESPEEKEKRDADSQARTANIAQDQARAHKRDILQSYAKLGRMRTEAIWALENDVYMNKDQILDYIEKKSQDPSLSALEYMHDLGHDVDGLFKNVTRFLTGAGINPAKIQAVQNKITQRMGEINERRLSEDAVDSKSWMKQTRAKHPDAKFMQAKMPGAPIRAYVNGKVVAEFNFTTDQKKSSEVVDEGQGLHAGDPVVVTAPNEFAGKTGEIHELSPSGKFIIVDLYNHGKHSMHLSDVEYNKYADDQEQDDWYDEDIEEGYATTIGPDTAPLPPEKRWRIQVRQLIADYIKNPQGLYNIAKQKGANSAEAIAYKFIMHPKGKIDLPPDAVTFEGYQDFNKAEPYAVCLAGKPIKKFDYYEQARKFHDNWKQKLYREGNKEKADKITLMPLNLDESAEVNEVFIRDGADWEDALRELNVFNDVFLSPDIQDTHEYTRDPEWQDLAKMIRNSAKVQEVYGQIKKFANLGIKLTSPEVKILDPLVWDGGGDMDINRLGDLYAHQLGAVETLLKTKNRGQGPNKTKSGQTIHEQGVTEAEDRVDPILIKALNNMPDGLATHHEVLDACYDAYAMELGKLRMKSEYGTTRVYIPKLMDLYKQKHGLDIKEEQKPLGFGEFPPKQEITIVPPKKLKSGQTYQDQNKYWQSQGQAPIYKTNEDTGSWIVYDPETKQIKKRFKTHTAGKSYARTHGLGFASSEFYFDRVKDNKEVAEGAMSNLHAELSDVYNRMAPGIERNRDSFKAGQLYDALEAVAEQHGAEAEFKRMMSGARNRAHMDYDTNPGGFQNWFWYLPFADEELSEEQDTSGVERAILNRIMVAHTDLLMKFGPDKVMQAAEEVAYNVGDVDEIGTSDVSAYVHQVKQILGVPEEVNEKWSQKYKSSINCANPKGFSQKAHCAGRKK
jgi:hypothetical protein